MNISKNNIVLFDLSNIVFSSFFAMGNTKASLDDNSKLDFYRYMILNQIRTNLKKFKPSEVILCLDSRSWRKEYFQFYKASRKIDKSKSEMYELAEKLFKEFQETLPYIIIREYGAEADDIIGVLINEIFKYKKEYQKIIISRDKDFYQLQSLHNVIQYDPYTHNFIENDLSPEIFKLMHILKGDTGDGIPNILSDDDTLINTEKKQKKVTKKIIDEYLNDLDNFVIKNNIINNYNRNKKLIVLDNENIPSDLTTKILFSYNSKKKEISKNNSYIKLLQYFKKHKIKSFYEEISDFLLDSKLEQNNDFSKFKHNLNDLF